MDSSIDPKENKVSLSALPELWRNSLRLTRIVWTDRPGMVLTMLGVLALASLTPFLQNGVFALLLNVLTAEAHEHLFSYQITLYTLLFLFIALLTPLLYKLQGYISKLFYFYLGQKFELLVLSRRAELDVAIQEDPKKNDLFMKIEEGSTHRAQNFVDRQFYIYQNLVEIVFASAIILYADWWVLLVLLAGTLPELLIEGRYGTEIWGIYSTKAEFRRQFWNLRSHFTNIPNLVELRLFQNVKHFYDRIAALFEIFQSDQRTAEKRKIKHTMSGALISQLAIGFTLFWFIYQVVQGEIEIGTLTFLLTSVTALRGALSGLFANIGRQYSDSLFVSDYFKFLNLPDVVVKPVAGIVLPKDLTPEIVFEKVSFRYEGAEQWALKDLSLTIKPGAKLAVVGVNGAGKTTFVKLLCRFYDPTEGRILIGGHDLRTLDIESWYHHLGILFQDYASYHFPVKEAIAIGRTDIPLDMERVKDAAESGEAQIFIEHWGNAYEQMLGKKFTGGVEPSIGQWQKLAIARTFYRDAQVLILDEPTSSIDAEAEAKIFEKMEHLSRDKTVILISHRFSTVRQADQICILEGGTISELGTHKELLEKNGTYARLFKLQAKGYE
ncbi:ABC transporter ATP-binding protein/permease [Candidatus Parcubacteria bacterium]|nr:ABC transporter ATP-binding protein/permease [Candidatus Parcubacteria bacterium]